MQWWGDKNWYPNCEDTGSFLTGAEKMTYLRTLSIRRGGGRPQICYFVLQLIFFFSFCSTEIWLTMFITWTSWDKPRWKFPWISVQHVATVAVAVKNQISAWRGMFPGFCNFGWEDVSGRSVKEKFFRGGVTPRSALFSPALKHWQGATNISEELAETARSAFRWLCRGRKRFLHRATAHQTLHSCLKVWANMSLVKSKT